MSPLTIASLPDGILSAIRSHVEAAYPQEACGVVLESADGLETFAGRNVDAWPEHQFRLHEDDLRLLGRRVALGARIAAIYHSHCDTPAVFSERDRAYAAAWPDATHLVACVSARGMLALHAFLADGTPIAEPEPPFYAMPLAMLARDA